MKLTGAHAYIFTDTLEASRVVYGNGSIKTSAATFYEVLKKGTGSNIPVPAGGFFRSPYDPATNKQITLVSGDEVFPINPKRYCKATADISAEMGTVDVSDDCSGATGESITDGFVNYSGSLGSFVTYDPVTKKLNDAAEPMIGRFFDRVTDDANGTYQYIPKDNSELKMLILLNANVKDGEFENWFCMNIILSSFSMSLGLKDAQNLDVPWSKGSGLAVKYTVPHGALAA
jgi:hypothetical protein